MQFPAKFLEFVHHNSRTMSLILFFLVRKCASIMYSFTCPSFPSRRHRNHAQLVTLIRLHAQHLYGQHIADNPFLSQFWWLCALLSRMLFITIQLCSRFSLAFNSQVLYKLVGAYDFFVISHFIGFLIVTEIVYCGAHSLGSAQPQADSNKIIRREIAQQTDTHTHTHKHHHHHQLKTNNFANALRFV